MKIVALILGVIALVLGLGLLFALPTMWIVNGLFSDKLLTSVFGSPSISIWQAWGLNIITSILFKSVNTKS